MRKTHCIISLFLASVLGMSQVWAADAAPQAPANDTSKLEQINAAPTDEPHKDCPMHQGKKECDHKKCDHKKDGKPCPYHQDGKHHGKSHEKCDPKQHGCSPLSTQD